MSSRGSAQETGPEKIGPIIGRILKQTVIRDTTRLEEVVRAWRAASGPELVGLTRVLSFRSGVLTVAVESAPLFQELETFRRTELLEEVRAQLGNLHVDQLKFRLE